jgi:hypothetical protein
MQMAVPRTQSKPKGQIIQINSQQANLAASATEAVTLKDNQFRIDALRPGSALLVGDVAVFN